MNCPIKGCKREIDNNRVMCGRHWASVPLAIRADIGRGIDRAASRLSCQYDDAYWASVREGIEAVNSLKGGPKPPGRKPAAGQLDFFGGGAA